MILWGRKPEAQKMQGQWTAYGYGKLPEWPIPNAQSVAGGTSPPIPKYKMGYLRLAGLQTLSNWPTI
jgi:hypothetical protein